MTGQRVLRGALVFALIAAGVYFRYYHGVIFEQNHLCQIDFPAMYAGGKLAGTPAIYDPAAVLNLERKSIGCENQILLFIKPPYYALLLSPFSRFSPRAAYLAWFVAMASAAGVFVWLWPGNRWVTLLATVWFVPVGDSAIGGQDVTLLLLFLSAGILLLKKGWLFSSGLFFGLLFGKFHLFFLLPLFLIRKKLWRTIAGACAMLSALLVISIWSAGGGLRRVSAWYNVLQDKRIETFVEIMPNLRGLLVYLPGLFWYALVAALALAIFLILKGSFETAWIAVVLGGILTSPHVYCPDLALLLPGLLTLTRLKGRLTKMWAVWLLLPFAFFWTPRWTYPASLAVLLVLMTVETLWDAKAGEHGTIAVPILPVSRPAPVEQLS